MWFAMLSMFAFSFVSSESYTFTTKYIEVPVDHFSFTSNSTFQLRYLINDTYHVERGPMFFYTGNEGDINTFAQNTGFMFDIAPDFDALIVFAEHRYYGTSLPFGNLSYISPKYLGYLSSEQALADFVFLVNDLQKTYSSSKDLKRIPVVAFGGSYGGMLAAWMRMKYPSSIVGAIASSAPIWQFKGLTPCENFNKITTTVYESLGGKKCSDTIRKSWAIIRSITNNDTGKSTVSKLWKLCSNIATQDDIETLVGWTSEIYVNLAMVNYPYSTSFLTELPANPVREFCAKLESYDYKNDIQLLEAIGGALEIYTNYTGKTTCNKIDSTSSKLDENGWYFQTCTEMVMPMCSTDADMFENEEWNFETYSNDCLKKFGIRPLNEEVPILEYGGKNIKDASNIVFSNGLLDPWSGGGVLSNITPTVFAVVIPDGAHHIDLRGRNAKDPESVRTARQFHVVHIKRWLDNYYFENLSDPLKYMFYNCTRS